MKQNKRNRRDPYFLCKIVNMVLAGAVLFLAVLIFVGDVEAWCIPLIFLLGMLMCALSGIMELAKSKRVIGYTCSVFSGILAVALILSMIRMW